MGPSNGRRDGRRHDNARLCCARCSNRLAPMGRDSLARQAIRARATRKASGEGVLGRLPRSDRAGCDLVDCSQQRAGADAALHAGRRLSPISCEVADARRSERHRGEYRQAAGIIGPPSDVGECDDPKNHQTDRRRLCHCAGKLWRGTGPRRASPFQSGSRKYVGRLKSFGLALASFHGFTPLIAVNIAKLPELLGRHKTWGAR